MAFPHDARAGAITSLLQKEALCMATSELSFSYKKSPTTEPRYVAGEVAADTAGEVAADTAGEVEVDLSA